MSMVHGGGSVRGSDGEFEIAYHTPATEHKPYDPYQHMWMQDSEKTALNKFERNDMTVPHSKDRVTPGYVNGLIFIIIFISYAYTVGSAIDGTLAWAHSHNVHSIVNTKKSGAHHNTDPNNVAGVQ